MLKLKITYVFIFLLLLLPHNASASDSLALKESAWLSPEINANDKLAALTQTPIECLNPNAPAIVSLGRLAFESPALLGGQAARIGLSCASCHPSGRTNSHFFIEGISNTPGSADITHSFFNSTEGNNTLTPVMIPDLARRDQVKIQNRNSSEFRVKLEQLIEVEFDGQHAPTTIIDALQTYLSHTDTQYCQTTLKLLQPISLKSDWMRLHEATSSLLDHPEKDTNNLLIRIARKKLEDIYLRYKNTNNQALEQSLIKLSRQLKSFSLEAISHKKQAKKLSYWRKDAATLFVKLKKNEANSTYTPSTLSKLIDAKSTKK